MYRLNKRSILFSFSLLLLFFFPVTWNSWIPRARNISLVILVLTGLIWFLLRSRLNTPFLIPKSVVLFLIYLALQAVLLVVAPAPKYGFHKVLTNLVYFFLFLFFIDSLRIGWTARIWENVLITFAVVTALISILVLILRLTSWWQISGRMLSLPPVGLRITGSILGHPNPVAGFMNLVIPVVLIRTLYFTRRAKRIYLSGLLFLFLITVFFSGSRGAWMGLAVGLGSTMMLINIPKLTNILKNTSYEIVNYAASIRSSINPKKLIVLSAILISGVGLAYLLSWNMDFIRHSPKGFADRLNIWKIAWNLYVSSPVWGHGPGSYPFLSASHSDEFQGRMWYYSPHNIGLQIGVETGIIGFLVILLFGYLFARDFVKTWRRPSFNINDQRSLAAYAGAGASVVVQHTVDVLILQMLYTLAVFLLAALVLSKTSRKEGFVLDNRKAFMLVSTLLVTIALGSFHLMKGAGDYWQGLVEADRDNWKGARDHICAAADLDQQDPFYAFQCGLANAFVASYYGDEQALQDAIEYTEQGLSQDPNWYVHWVNLATYEWRAGEKEKAVTHMREAVAKSRPNTPLEPLFYLNLAWMEEKVGSQVEAVEAYKTAQQLNPWLRQDPFFAETSIRQASQSTPELDNPYFVAWDYLRRDELRNAELILEKAMKSDPGSAIASAVLAYSKQLSGHPEDAWRYVQLSFFTSDSDMKSIVIAAHVAEDQGRKSEAMTFLGRAYILLANYSSNEVYYDAAYHRNSIPVYLSPFLIRIGFSAEDNVLFNKLVEYLSENGDETESQKVLNWLDYKYIR
jgi:O-antigen ligase/tetratricopeptide (TPR) repeat protein